MERHSFGGQPLDAKRSSDGLVLRGVTTGAVGTPITITITITITVPTTFAFVVIIHGPPVDTARAEGILVGRGRIGLPEYRPAGRVIDDPSTAGGGRGRGQRHVGLGGFGGGRGDLIGPCRHFHGQLFVVLNGRYHACVAVVFAGFVRREDQVHVIRRLFC